MLSLNQENNPTSLSYLKNNYKLGLCHIFNPELHGINQDSDLNIIGHYLVICTEGDDEDDGFTDADSVYTASTLDSSEDENIKIQEIMNLYKKMYREMIRTNEYIYHPIINNYKNIISNRNYIQLEIFQKIYLEGDECIAILKTFWIRIIQKTWKKIYQKRKDIMNKRKNIKSILYRELNSKWPPNCSYLPSIYGMLLKN